MGQLNDSIPPLPEARVQYSRVPSPQTPHVASGSTGICSTRATAPGQSWARAQKHAPQEINCQKKVETSRPQGKSSQPNQDGCAQQHTLKGVPHPFRGEYNSPAKSISAQKLYFFVDASRVPDRMHRINHFFWPGFCLMIANDSSWAALVSIRSVSIRSMLIGSVSIGG